MAFLGEQQANRILERRVASRAATLLELDRGPTPRALVWFQTAQSRRWTLNRVCTGSRIEAVAT